MLYGENFIFKTNREKRQTGDAIWAREACKLLDKEYSVAFLKTT